MENLRGRSREDWLIVCGDVSELSTDLEWALGVLRERFATVVWVPGNHDLWSTPGDPLGLRGEARYRHLVAVCRRLSVLTPEDPYPLWDGPGGPLTVVPLFVLYDYSFGRNVAPTKEQALARAHAAGVVCSDELVLHPDPYPTREAWCEARVRESEARLAASSGGRADGAGQPLPADPPPHRGSCATRSLRSGAGPCAPPTGTCASGPRRWCTATCTSPA